MKAKKVAFCIIPRRLARINHPEGMEFIGWVWMQKVMLTNNLNHGWVAFLDDPIIEECSKCHRPMN